MAAPKSAVRKPRKKEKKNIAPWARLTSSRRFNNTIVTITDPSGAVVQLGFVGNRRFQGVAQVDPVRRAAFR